MTVSLAKILVPVWKAVLAGVVLFVLLSIFASDPSPEEEKRADPPERSCKNDWRKCGSDQELLKNWNYELGKTQTPQSPGSASGAGHSR
jgi:hypothetical protein